VRLLQRLSQVMAAEERADGLSLELAYAQVKGLRAVGVWQAQQEVQRQGHAK
jgi:hypothetical protein